MSDLATREDVFASIRDWAPTELLAFLDQIALLLPEELRYRLKTVMDTLPSEGDNMYKVLEVVRNQWMGIQSQAWVRIALVGPAQTGKSSLIKAISRKQEEGAPPIFTVVDLQVLDEFLGYRDSHSGPEELKNADSILLILDARFELAGSTLQMHERLRDLSKPLLVVLNKIDQVEHPRNAIRAAKEQLRGNVLGISAFRPESIDKLLKAVVTANPGTLHSLTQNFPGFRRTICNGIVTQAAFASGLVGAIPIPVSDLLPITAIQTGMVLKIARAFGHKLDRERARELLPMLAAGTLAREGSHRLRRQFPEHRKLIAVSVAGVWSFLLGQVTIRYFENVSNCLASGNPAGLPWVGN